MEYSRIHRLDTGTTERFSCPFFKNLVRTGVLGEGSCFFHALMYSDETYRNSNDKIKEKYVRKIRKRFADELTQTDWEVMGNSVVSNMLFQKNVREFFLKIYSYFTRNI